MADRQTVIEDHGHGAGIPAGAAVVDQLQRILASPMFSSAPRLSRLLRYLVEHSAAVDGEVQEYALGVEVFDRGAAFDPRADAIVRVQARRLRMRLDAYYQGPGRKDPVLIEVPKGHYRPLYRHRQPPADPPSRRRSRPTRAWGGALVLAGLLAAVLSWLVWQAPAETPPHQAIAVLPFRSLNDDPQNAHFSDGISAEVLHELARYPGLKVVATVSPLVLEDQDADFARLGELLGAGYLLQGSVRRQGQRLRITAQLVDRAGVQLWSDAFDRSLGDVFHIQQEIAAAVAASVAPQVSFEPGHNLPPNVDAYRHYLIGREILAKRLPTFVQDGVEQLRRALEIDPGYADAHAELAIALTLASAWWRTGPCCLALAVGGANPLDQARQAIDTALLLEPNLARAHAAEGLWLQMQDTPDFEGSERALRRAKALDPNQVDTLNWLSGAMAAQGRAAESLAELDGAARLDPLALSVNLNLAREYAVRGNFSASEQRLRNLLELPVEQPLTHLDLAGLYNQTGRLAEGNWRTKEALLKYIEVRGEVGLLEFLGTHYAMLGMWDRAHYWLDRMEATAEDAAQAAALRAYPMQLEGRHQEMLTRFRAALDRRGLEPSQLAVDDAAEYGILLALTGNHTAAVALLEPRTDVSLLRSGREGHHVAHALAWAHLRAGSAEKAARIVQRLEVDLGTRQSNGLLHLGDDLMMFAQNAVLLDDAELAAERLEAAARAGWRNYYAVAHDPRWTAARQHPRIAAVLAWVKAEVDRERAQVEDLDRGDGFELRLERLAAHARNG